MKKTERNLRKGFTLLEVLIVVLIAVVVVSFSVPAYKKTQEKNRYMAAQAVLLDLANGVRMLYANYPNYTPTFTNAYCGISANSTNNSNEPPVDSCGHIVYWMMSNKYISQIPFNTNWSSNRYTRYMGYYFRIGLTGGAIACCTKATNDNAIACMGRSSETGNVTPTCAWVTPDGELKDNVNN